MKLKMFVVLVATLLAQTVLAAPLPVTVSILPQRYFVEQIGKDLVTVSVMVSPGQSPATYEPKPRQMAALAKSKLYFAIGVPFENVWLHRIAAANKAMTLVHTDAGIKKRPMAAHHHHEAHDDHDAGHKSHGHHDAHHNDHDDHKPHGHHDAHHNDHDDHKPHGHHDAHHNDHDDRKTHGHHDAHHNDHDDHRAEADHKPHGLEDPHIWLDPNLVAIQAAHIRDALMKALPEHKNTIEQNTQAFLQKLANLDQEIRILLKNGPEQHRSFMVFHPSWGYFAHAYGLHQVPIEIEGKEPSPRELAELIRHGRENQVRVLFVQPQFSDRSAKVIATQIGAEVARLDPLATDWDLNLKAAATAISGGLH